MTKKCKICKQPLLFSERNGLKTYKQKQGIGIVCCLTSDHPEAKKVFQKFVDQNKIKFRKEVKAKDRQETKEKKEKLKTLGQYKNDLQKEINTIVRLIDKGHPCIATKSHNGKQNAGHYIGVGSNDTLRFHLENIWLQSEHSNMWKSGDTLRYQDGIVSLYGKDYLERLNGFKSIKPIKLTVDDIKEKISICRGIIKWLKLQDRMFDKVERMQLRIKFNKEIAIYQ